VSAASKTQLRVLLYLAQRFTFREIASEFGWASTNSLADHAKALQRKGLLVASKKKGASYRYEATNKGLDAVGMARCWHCDGLGLLSVVL
jgi:hypothetical protein